jgi:uncharacterized GH25 family protein
MTARMYFYRKLAGPAVALSVLAALPAAAHDFWLQPDNFRVTPGGTTAMSLQVGHGKDRQKSLMAKDRVLRFDSISGVGRLDRKRELRLGDANTNSVLTFKAPGLHVLAFETNGTYSELPAIRFNDYLKAEGLTPAITQRVNTRATDKPGREIYSRRAKALVQAGAYSPKDDALVTKPVGLTLEIVPQANPYAPDFKGKLPVRILYMGKPLARATVMLNNLDFDSRPVEKILSDAQGLAVFDLPRTGSWQFNVIWTRPISQGKADFDTVFSSLTLGY